MAKNLIFATILKVLLSFSLINLCYPTASYYNFDFRYKALDPKTTGFMISGDGSSGGYLGYSVSTAGDINNDGYDDIIIGVDSQYMARGVAYVVYGGDISSMSNLDLNSPTALDPATTGFKITAAADYDQFGVSVSSAGDINKDGYDDILVRSPIQGAVYVIYGGEKSSMKDLDLSFAPLNPATTGFTITGNEFSDILGCPVSTAGDFNKDGYDDIIIGSFEKNSYQGVVYVIYGREKSLLGDLDLATAILDPATTGFKITGQNFGDQLGYSVSTAGDINKDGYDDIIIGTPWKDNGVVYVIYGREKSLMTHIDLSSGTTTLDPATTGFMITGNAGDSLGRSMSTAGDIDNDGYNDIMIGAYGKDSNRGASYIIYGGEKSSMSNIDLSVITLDPVTTGFLVKGKDYSDQFGWSVSTAGDINKDGYDDIIIGLNNQYGSQITVYVIYGGKKSSMSNIDFSGSTTTLDPAINGFIITGSDYSEYFGYSVSTAGDIDRDGYKDILIGAYQHNGAGAAYVIHTACSPCYNCPVNCNTCNGPSSCLQCMSPSLLHDSQCLTSCPTSTFKSANICEDCPPFCSSCTSPTTCQVCHQGYILSKSICVAPTLKAEAKALQAVSSGSQAIGSIVCVGSATFPLTALVSKIVQNTRYLDLSVSDELAEIYKTWNTEMISWQVPNVIARSENFKQSPSEFSRYEIDSSFLANFWPTLMTIVVGGGIFIACFTLQMTFERINYKGGWVYSLLQKLLIGSFNFALVQVYGCLDDILFYFILDVKTNPFGTFFSWASVICAFALLAIGCLLIFLNFWTVKKYQSIKNMKELKAFNEKNQYWELFYSTFDDNDFWSQSFLALGIIRSCLSSLIIAALYDFSIVQTTSLVVLDVAVIAFLLKKKPFNTLCGKLAQYYFEIITLLVHLCTFILSVNKSSSEGLRGFLSMAIIYLNTALVTGGTGFMFIEIYETMKEKVKSKLKYDHIAIQTAAAAREEEDLSEMTSPIRNSIIEDENQGKMNKERNVSFENLKVFSRLNKKENMSESPEINDSNMNADNSVVSDLNTSNLTSTRRDQSSLTLMMRRKPLFLKQQQQLKRNLSMIRNHAAVYPESSEES